MNRETLILAAIQSGILFLVVWMVFRLVPSIPANTKAWIWRLSFLKPVACLLPFAAVTLHVLPTTQVPVAVQETVVDVAAQGPTTATLAVTSPIVENAPAISIDPFLALWVMGMAAVLLYGVVNWVRVARMVRRADPIRDPQILQALDDLRHTSRTAKQIRLLASKDVKTPLLTGIVSPLIVLPSRAVEQEPIEDIRLMLAHEVAHLARKDLAWFGLVWVVQSLFFFNPVVWLAVRCARLDHESATDEHASNLAEVPIQTYAEMLLRATVVTRTSLAPGVLPMSESYRTIHRRIEAMRHFQSKPSFWRRSAFAALALSIVGLLPVYQLAEAAPGQQGQPPLPPQVSVPGMPVRPPKVVKAVKGKKVKPAKQKSAKGKNLLPPRVISVPGQAVPAGQPPLALPGQAVAPASIAAPRSVPGQPVPPLPGEAAGIQAPTASVPGHIISGLPPTQAQAGGTPPPGINVPPGGATTIAPAAAAGTQRLPGEAGGAVIAPQRGKVGENGVQVAAAQAANTRPYSVALNAQGTPATTTYGVALNSAQGAPATAASGVAIQPGQTVTTSAQGTATTAYGVLAPQGQAKYTTTVSTYGVLAPQGKTKYTTTATSAYGVLLPRGKVKYTTPVKAYTLLSQGKGKTKATTLKYLTAQGATTSKPLTTYRVETAYKLAPQSTTTTYRLVTPQYVTNAQGRLTYATKSSSGKISLKYQDADVRQVLAVLFQQSGKNFIIDERVKGNVTVSFNDLAFADCLDAVLKTVNASFKIEKGIYRVFPRGK